MIITPGTDLTGVTAKDLIEVPLSPRSLPARAPAEAWAHLRAYAARPDVGPSRSARCSLTCPSCTARPAGWVPAFRCTAMPGCSARRNLPTGPSRRSARPTRSSCAATERSPVRAHPSRPSRGCGCWPRHARSGSRRRQAGCPGRWTPARLNPGGQSSPSLDRGCGSTCGEGRRLRPRRPRRQQSDPSARLYGRLARSDGPHARRTLSSLANTRPSSVSASRL